MPGSLDWKWIGLGVLIMLALSILAGVIAGLFLAPDLQSASDAQDIQLTGSQAVLLAISNLLVFAIGGFIVGLKSAGRTIWEPGISAAIAVTLALVLSGNLSIGNLLAGGLVPFLAGVFGGWLGERRQGAGPGPGTGSGPQS